LSASHHLLLPSKVEKIFFKWILPLSSYLARLLAHPKNNPESW
jgi:hypothetical protein